MSDERALMVPLQDTLKLGEVLARSGFFADAKEASQAVVKVLAGQELGFGPIASMTGIHIVQGKPALGANLIASQIKRYGNYDFSVIELTDEVCTISISENGTERGRASFTIAEAQKAGLTGKQTWKAYPSDMLFARTITRAARRFCPDVLSGMPIYVPEELGAEVDESGDVIDVTPAPTIPSPPPPAPAPVTKTSNGRKTATISTKRWAKAAAAVAADHPHYCNTGGDINFYHMTAAAAKLGYAEVTDDNLSEVCQKLREYAAERDDDSQAELPL